MKTYRNCRRLTSGIAAAMFAALTLAPLTPAFSQAPPAPPTSADAKDFEAADDLFQKGDFKGAMQAFEKFREKYKGLSPRSLDAAFRLAISYLKQEKPLFDDAVRELRALTANQKVSEEAREMAQLLIAKALTMKAAQFTAETEAQKVVYQKALGDAIKEYDLFLTTYPRSKETDAALYLSAQLLVAMESYEEGVKRFATIVQRFQQSPFVWDAQMWIGKAWFISANQLLNPTDKGKPREPKPDEVAKAKQQFAQAQPALVEVYSRSGDIALANEAIYYVAQMQLSRANLVEVAGDEDPKKAERDALLKASLDAFRAVRSVEEVVAQQEAKIKRFVDAKRLVPPASPNYMAAQNRLDSIISNEQDKVDQFKKTQDMYLTARISIARIFLFLKKADESRSLLRYLSGQKELWESEAKKNPAAAKESEASVSALLCLTYTETKNVAKAIEAYEAFRAAFKGNPAGENLPLLVANVVVDAGQPDKAEEIVKQGMEDYQDWRFANDAVRILISVALQKGDFEKAAQLADEVLSRNPKPDVEVQTLFLKGTIQQAQAREKRDESLADKALETFKVVISKAPNSAEAEQAEFSTCEILAAKNPASAIEPLKSFISKFSSGTPKSENTPYNVAVAQFRLAQSLEQTGKKDEAIAEYRKIAETKPDSDVAPGTFFKVFSIYADRKDYPAALKVMEEFIKKYPKHENVYFAFNNIAEIIFSGNHQTKPGPDGKTLVAANPGAIENTEQGAKMLYDYVAHEIANEIQPQRGEGSLIKIADKWIEQLKKLPNFVTMNNDQKLVWQKGVDGVIAAAEKQIQTYPEGSRLGEMLERLVIIQKERTKAQQVKSGDVDNYFNDLAQKHGKTPVVKAKLQFALASYLAETDAETAFTKREKAFKEVPDVVKKQVDNREMIERTFTPGDYDGYLGGLFEKKRYDDITKIIARIRTEYPVAEGGGDPIADDAHSVALYWEAKILGEQGKTTDAGQKFAELREKFPRSKKVGEAEYGEILGKFEQTRKVEDDYISRLTKIVNNVRDVKDFELPAKALFLIGRLQEANQDYDNAIDTYIKIHTRYASVPGIAGDGLWAGAQLLEKQAKGELKVMTAAEKKAAAEETARKAKAAAEKKAEEEKKKAAAGKKPGDKDQKPDDATQEESKTTDPKPADATTARADSEKK